MFVPSFFISPGLIGKVFGAKDERAIRWGTATNREAPTPSSVRQTMKKTFKRRIYWSEDKRTY